MKSPQPVLLLDRSAVSELLTLDECIDAVESAFASHARGMALHPGLMHVSTGQGEFHIKAGGLTGKRTLFVTKIGGGFFKNRAELDLPNIIGLILLADGDTGAPLALMESGLITRLRTAAATAVAAKYLARSDSRTVTICGAGAQGESQLRALTRVLKIERAFVWSRSGSTEFAERMSEALDLAVEAVQELGQATRESDVIVTCTPAKRWFLGREHVRPGTFIAAIGADSPDKQEIEPELLAQSSVFCDLIEQCAQVGDLHHAIAKGLAARNAVRGELGAVVIGTAVKRVREDEIIIFDSTGTALQDAAAATVVYERALRRGGGRDFNFWG
jgi:ornithine cyclodeaminase/alanine dehydrogenase-like protein (mu-crystallin family)